MNVLLLGVGGMLGHKLAQRLSASHRVTATLRAATAEHSLRQLLPEVDLRCGIGAENLPGIATLMKTVRPDAIINCIGIIKQQRHGMDALPSISINALFPHQLAALCSEVGARLLHFSTDCVFSGMSGPYRPDSPADARDLYGRTKHMGEVGGPGCLTIRSSIIGHELKGYVSLVDWFLSQRDGRVKGFANALYTGLPTVVMAEVVRLALEEWRDLEGVWQVASDSINKYDLLQLVNHIYGLGITILRDEDFRCDRRLDGSAFRAQTGWVAPPWPAMVSAMYADYIAARSGRRTC